MENQKVNMYAILHEIPGKTLQTIGRHSSAMSSRYAYVTHI